MSAKANSFENLLDPFLKIFRLSSPVTVGIARSQFFKRIIDKLGHSKAVVRLNLLRILRTVCDVHPSRAMLVERFAIHDIVMKLSEEDGAVLVRELARDILPTLAPALKPASSRIGKGLGDTPKSAIAPKKKIRRAASESAAALPPPVFTSLQVRAASRISGTSSGRSIRQTASDAPQAPKSERR